MPNDKQRPATPAEELAILEMMARELANKAIGTYLRNGNSYRALLEALRGAAAEMSRIVSREDRCPDGTYPCGRNMCCLIFEPPDGSADVPGRMTGSGGG